MQSDEGEADGGPGELRRRGIQSVEIGLRVLSAVSAGQGPIALGAVAQASGLSASQAHRYLVSLMAAGMVKQEGRSGLYDLDAGAIRLGLAALGRLNLLTQADEIFTGFVRSTGRTCLLAVWGDAGPTIVRWFPGYPPVTTSLAVGSVMSLLRSATGHVFLTFGDRPIVERQAERERSLAPLPADFDEQALTGAVRRRTMAFVTGEFIPGLRAQAAPVFDLQGRLALVATSVASPAIDPGKDTTVTEALAEACRTLTESLGGSWPSLHIRQSV